jgi:hypothetical protein
MFFGIAEMVKQVSVIERQSGQISGTNGSLFIESLDSYD